MTGAEILHSIAANETMAGLDLTGAKILKTGFRRCDFPGVRFHGTDLTNVNFMKMNLAVASFREATLHQTLLTHANLAQADF